MGMMDTDVTTLDFVAKVCLGVRSIISFKHIGINVFRRTLTIFGVNSSYGWNLSL